MSEQEKYYPYPKWLDRYKNEKGVFMLSHTLILADVIMELIMLLKERAKKC